LPGGNEILISLQERDAVFEMLQSLIETLMELVVHYRSS
jgi:hypothetical protein